MSAGDYGQVEKAAANYTPQPGRAARIAWGVLSAGLLPQKF